MKPFYITLAVIALGGVGWILYSLSNGGGQPALAVVPLTEMEGPELLEAAHGSTLGQPDAPVQVLVFSDYTCPSCKHWVTNVEPYVRQDFIDAGKVKLVHYDFPLGGPGQHQHSFIAARAARCAEAQNKFWEYHDVLFGRQNEWASKGDPPLSDFVDYAGQVGADTKAFEACLKSDQFADVVSASRKLGEELHVGGTPTVYIGSRAISQWGDYSAVKAAIESELGGA